MKEQLLSVGIDLGTSTTQLVFSRLTVENRASAFSVPDVAITEKEILYKSRIHFTPLLNDTAIDAAALRNIVAREYEAAGVDKRQVDTGAVIITGETARKDNAKQVLQTLSDFAGDFVVATAGPDLESVLAGAGAGADAYSAEHGCSVLHFDIGGGTTNMPLYEKGELKATGCLNVGGRLIKVADGKISYLSPVLQGLTPLHLGQNVTEEALQPVIDLLVQTLENMAFGHGDVIPKSLRTTELMPLPQSIDVFSFSGGVADLIYTEEPPAPFAYGDLGVLLGQAIRKSRLFDRAVTAPGETIRATVVGAGSHSTKLSGSTVTYANAAFPYRDLPVLALNEEEQADLKAAVERKLKWFHESGEDMVALYLPGYPSPTFSQVCGLADAIVQTFPQADRLFLITKADISKALGQAILGKRPQLELVCMDGLTLSQGSYVDIGRPVAGGAALPVVVKTLIFEK